MKIGITVVLLCVVVTQVFASESYLCVGDMSTGFLYNKATKIWETARFKEKSYVFKKETGENSKLWEWKVTGLGSDFIESYCEKGFDDTGGLYCQGMSQTFRMDKNRLRFLKTMQGGYEDGRGTPSIEIGKCSPKN